MEQRTGPERGGWPEGPPPAVPTPPTGPVASPGADAVYSDPFGPVPPTPGLSGHGLAVPDPAVPDPPRGRRRGWRVVAVLLVGALVLAGGGLAALRFWPQPGPWVSAADLGAGAARVVEDHPVDEPLVLEVSYDTAAVDPDLAVRVFLDEGLTAPAPDARVSAVGDELWVAPAPEALRATSGDSVVLAEAGRWGFSDRYYVVEHLDPATGAQLAQPRMTVFTVRTGAPSPDVTYRVDDTGVAEIGWQSVAQADRYQVVQYTDDRARVLATVDGTSWRATEGSAIVLAGDDDARSQNAALDRVRYSDDRLRGEDYVEGNTVDDPVYGVVAVAGDGRSGLTPVPDEATDQPLPVSVARHAQAELGATAAAVTSTDALPTRLPVTMTDGTTRLFWLTYDQASVTASTDGTFTVTYSVDGTLFDGTYQVTALDQAAALAGVAGAAARVEQARAEDPDPVYAYQQPAAPDLDAVEVATSAPDVTAHGSTELVRYLGAHLVAGNEYIDLGDHMDGSTMSATDGTDLWDALWEALFQNPLALNHPDTEYAYVQDRQILMVEQLGWTSAQERVQEQAEVTAVVQAAVAQIITPGMSEADRVRAINRHLVDVAAYDDDALAAELAGDSAAHWRAWTPSGVLLLGRGVCQSYADAFLLLADAAGLTSVVVTGTAVDGGEAHAWNKVLVDGVWRVVDPTWNDTPGLWSETFLLQTDAQTAADRVEDQDWVVDAHQGAYAAG